MRLPSVARASLVLSLAWLSGCPTNPPPDDAGTDATQPDGGPDGGPSCVSILRSVGFSHPTVGVTPGAVRTLSFDLGDNTCEVVELDFTASTPGIVSFPATATIDSRRTSVPFEVTGIAPGSTVITARLRGRDFMATLNVDVVAPNTPTCTGMRMGRIEPNGVRLEGTGMLEHAALMLPAGAAAGDVQFRVPAFDATVACAPSEAIPAGYTALGPAISFTSATVNRFPREIEFSLPISLALLPSRAHRGHVEIAYTGPGITTPRIVAMTSPVFAGEAGNGTLRFLAQRLGTYRAVVRSDAPRSYTRTYNRRAILGFSMGGSGSGRIGLSHPELFDFVAPLGGPTEWTYLLEYIRRYHLGGFCTFEERLADTTGRCNQATTERPPFRPNEFMEHTQSFENWWYADGHDGNGGTFDRNSYISIFRDLAAMFGNPNTDTDGFDVARPLTPSIAPPGTPESWRLMPDRDRCAAGAGHITIPGRCPTAAVGDACTAPPGNPWYDDEYNPDGRWDIISFCDGAQRAGDTGNWDPMGSQYVPIEVAYAVDVNHNGLRDAGEPVIRNGRETFDDFGCDRIPSAMEPGYNAVLNPDPAGDDYDFVYNPTGTETNYDWDGEGTCPAGQSERFDDFGIDGVNNTPQLVTGMPTSGWDVGEGDGRFNRTRGADRMISSSPRAQVRGYRDRLGVYHPGVSAATLDGFDIILDGGVRDLFNWSVQGNHTLGGFAARGLPVRYYNGFASLHMDGRTDGFEYARVPWRELGRRVMTRYGSIDASEADQMAGDGEHVGTVDQLFNRVQSPLAQMSALWPGGDRVRRPDAACERISGSCDHINVINDNFTSSVGREGPFGLVLPPGYFDESQAGTCYPIVYFLHGYGMDPTQLTAIGLVLWGAMNATMVPEHQRIQKMIFAFPDGRCRNAECLRGTFYTNAPESTPNGAQMETWLLELDEHIRNDMGVRVCAPETVTVTE